MHTTRASLLQRIKDPADSLAWQEFDGIYRPLMTRFARAQGLDEAAAEDIAQHCLVAVHEHIGGFDYDPRKGQFKGWLRTIVNNRVRNFLRDRRERQAATGLFADASAGDQSPESLFDQLWTEEHLKHCLRLVRDEVAETTFRAFQEYVIDERPIEQVCAANSMSANQVHAIKYRVIKRLREQMKELIDGQHE